MNVSAYVIAHHNGQWTKERVDDAEHDAIAMLRVRPHPHGISHHYVDRGDPNSTVYN